MTIAQPNMEPSASEHIVAKPRATRVLLIAHTPSLADVMLGEMAQDANVTGSVFDGTLAGALAADASQLQSADFVVFELDDIAADLAALATLSTRTIAVAKTTIDADQTARLKAAGVQDVMTLKAPETAPPPAPVVAPAPAPTPIAQTGGQVIVFMRARGGAGATTLATNLAVGQAASASTALIDLDIQNGAIALALDLSDSGEATKLIKGQVAPDAAFLDRAMQRHSSGLDVLTAPDVFAPLSAITPALVARLIDTLRGRYAHVVIDMPQAVVEWIAPVLERASKVVLVSDMTLPALKRSKRLLDLIGDEHMTLPVQTVINFEKKPMFKSAAHKEAERLIGQPLDHWVPANAAAARRATDMGIPLTIGAKRAPISKAIATLGAAIFAVSDKE